MVGGHSRGRAELPPLLRLLFEFVYVDLAPLQLLLFLLPVVSLKNLTSLERRGLAFKLVLVSSRVY